MSAAEELLDELLKSDVDINLDSLDVQTNDAKEPEKEIDQENEFKIKSQDDSGFFEMSNVTQVITEDGRQIVIMIAPPSPDSSTKVDEDDTTSYIAPESLATVDEDSEWCPDSPTSSRGRPAVKRSATKKQKRTAPYITDKKERKKQQNVEAARRYRDKKKAEQCDVDVEEQVLINRNKELKSKVSELEAEMKTMKKLMKELGILK